MAKDVAATTQPKRAEFSNAYEMFILVLTILSLVVMVLLVLPLPEATKNLLTIYDNLICVIFLFDFVARLRRSPTAGQYFFHERGWLDLLGSIPSLGIFRFAGLLRLARLSRLARIFRLLRGQKRHEILNDVLTHRGQYAAFVTIMAASVVLVIASIVVLSFEANKEGSNIKTGGDALWWAIVTMTTVGYGDRYPTTPGGRITGVFVMFMGVGIIGALASILASFLVAPTSAAEEAPATDAGSAAEPSTAAGVEDAPATAGAGAAVPAAEGTAPLAAGGHGAAAVPVAAEIGSTPALEAELHAIREELEALRQTIGTHSRESGTQHNSKEEERG